MTGTTTTNGTRRWATIGVLGLILLGLLIWLLTRGTEHTGAPQNSATPTAATSDTGAVDPSGSQQPSGQSSGASASTTPSSSTGATGSGGGADLAALRTCPAATVPVTSAEELTSALAAAQPGTVIGLAPGTYSGTFTLNASGTQAEPIWVCGPREAILDGGGIKGGYVIHLDGARDVVLSGFTVTNGQKGVMVDAGSDVHVQQLSVHEIGDEAIHLRRGTIDSAVVANVIRDTGQRKDKFGEGVYVGTAESNWCEISECKPDPSDRNVIRGNDIAAVTAEAVDIKEGTSDGTLIGNTLDGAGTSAADSVVDVKGSGWSITGNTVTNAPKDGFQTHQIASGWGTDNRFRGNIVRSLGDGVAIALTPVLGNIVSCDNTAPAGRRMTNTTCMS